MSLRRIARVALATTAVTVALTMSGSALAAGSPGVSGAAVTASTSRQGTGTLFGATAQRKGGDSLAEAVRRQDRKYGHMGVLRLFYTGLPDNWDRISAGAGSRALVISFKARPASIVAGDHDAYFREWFANAPNDRRVFWSFWHEPEDDIARGAFAASTYRAAWSHLATIARTVGSPKLRATLVLMCWTLERGSHRDWRDYYSASAIRVLSWDCYNAGYSKGKYRSPSDLFTDVRAVARSTGKAFGISELGSRLANGDRTGRERARWLSRVSRYLDDAGARFVTYFDSNIGVEFRLLDRPSARSWRRSVSG